MHNWRLIILLLTSLVSSGCQSFNFMDRFNLERRIPWKSDDKEVRQGVPVRIVTTWTDAVLHRPNKAERGFGGRLYFYDNKGSDPIEVDGQLVVYAFNETNRDPTDNRPNRRYVFPPEQFQLHKSDSSELGVSYSVFLPWDADQNGPPADISLIARFEPEGKGNLITSEQNRLRLPGQGPIPGGDKALAQQSIQPGVQHANVTQSTIEPKRTVHQINYETEISHVTPPSQEPQRMTTTNISLPSRFRKENATVPVPSTQAPPAISIPAKPAPNDQSATDMNFEGTQITMLTPGESVRQSIQRRSFGSPPASLPVQATPVSP